MTPYEKHILNELHNWEQLMQKKPGWRSRFAQKTQAKINSYIPEKVHKAITAAIKQMIKVVLSGSEWLTGKPEYTKNIEEREIEVDDKIGNYQKTAAVEGGVTGAGGILLGLADFPVLLAIKIKLLFEIATLYGYDVRKYSERVFILLIFQLAFCSTKQRNNVFAQLKKWVTEFDDITENVNEPDWRILQQEYRDYLDLAKLAQLLPVVGAPIGFVVNYRLVRQLGETAKFAYRMRWERDHALFNGQLSIDNGQ